MNKLITTSLLASAAVASAATISYTGSVVTSGASYSNINLSKFNSTLGTLTGVKVEVTYSNFGGSFSAIAPTDGDSVFVNSVLANITLRQASSNDVGFTTVTLNSLTPSTNFSLPSGEITAQTVEFLTSGAGFSTNSYNIGSAFISLFDTQTSGLGNITFQVRNQSSVNNTVYGNGSVTNAITLDTGMKVTYTYTAAPVPEPSTYGIALGGLALVGAIVRRRKQAK